MIGALADYAWSSYRAIALGGADPVVWPHVLYAALGNSPEKRQTAYRRLFADVLGDDLLSRIRESVNGGFVLGSDRFEREIAAVLGRRT